MSFLLPISLLYLALSGSGAAAGNTKSKRGRKPVYEDDADQDDSGSIDSAAQALLVNADVIGVELDASPRAPLPPQPPPGWSRVQWQLAVANITWWQVGTTGIWGGFLFLIPNYCWFAGLGMAGAIFVFRQDFALENAIARTPARLKRACA
jgi:hypothetical protein